jgi:hypothetical protein
MLVYTLFPEHSTLEAMIWDWAGSLQREVTTVSLTSEKQE